jgi:hypothetical protein
MNRYQKAVATIAAINILLLLLFPPFLDNPIQRGVLPSFEGFYLLFMAPAGRTIDQPLLTIEILFVAINALVAWLVLNKCSDNGPRLSEIAVTRNLLLFGVVNFALIFLFPPFEPYASLIRMIRQEGFDGFYFAFGDKRQREIFAPLLYLEVIFVTINLLATWLVFGLLRGSLSAIDAHLLEAAHHVAPEKLDALIHQLEDTSAATPVAASQTGHHQDRRQCQEPNYCPERRSGHDRRHLPR